MNNSAPTTEQLVHAITELTDYISVSENQIRQGEELDMSGVDDQVQALCDRIESAPPAVKKPVEPHLAKMIMALEKLADALEVQLADAHEGQNGDEDEDE
tara:strand:+ start:79 stop:378 length:300 start_codon:yes stop_codon:yes gene_type:complete